MAAESKNMKTNHKKQAPGAVIVAPETVCLVGKGGRGVLGRWPAPEEVLEALELYRQKHDDDMVRLLQHPDAPKMEGKWPCVRLSIPEVGESSVSLYRSQDEYDREVKQIEPNSPVNKGMVGGLCAAWTCKGNQFRMFQVLTMSTYKPVRTIGGLISDRRMTSGASPGVVARLQKYVNAYALTFATPQGVPGRLQAYIVNVNAGSGVNHEMPHAEILRVSRDRGGRELAQTENGRRAPAGVWAGRRPQVAGGWARRVRDASHRANRQRQVLLRRSVWD
jgi:hypothetical protein